MLVLTSNTLTILTPCLTLTSTFTVITTAVEHSVLTNTAAQASTHTPDTRADWTCQILSLGRAAAAFNVCDETHVFPEPPAAVQGGPSEVWFCSRTTARL